VIRSGAKRASRKQRVPAPPRSDRRALRGLLIAPRASLRQALQIIDRGQCELAFVADRHGRIVGTLSDGDVRRAILRGVPLDTVGAVGEAMCKNFVHVGPELHRAEVLDMMRARTISQIPVLDAGDRIIGLHMLQDLIGAAERPNRAVIMCGGQGMRLRPFTETVPKPMLTVAGRPILERLVLHLLGHGVKEIYLAINYLGHVIEDHFGDGSAFGCRIHYLRERKPLGTGGALSLLPKGDKHPVLVVNGDLVTQARIDRVFEFHERGGFTATVCLRPHTVEIPFGVAQVQDERLVALREKPVDQILINSGMYVLSQRALRLIPRDREYPITQLLETCLAKKLPVGAHVLEGDWLDVGRHDELRLARGQG
jgi:dTDP-glucose pyrophosphorylase/CBS domain-containing protein